MPRIADELVPPSPHLVSVRIDPTWPHRRLWEEVWGSVFDAKQRLAFSFFDTESGIEEQAEAQYADIDVLGRAEMYKTYTGTSNRTIPLTVQFQAQGLNGANRRQAALDEVVNPAKWLDSLKYPVVDRRTGLSHAPPTLFLQIGQLYMGRVVATEVTIRWQSPFDPDTMFPQAAEVTCAFTEVNRRPGAYRAIGPRRIESLIRPGDAESEAQYDVTRGYRKRVAP
jgi:hypothetical protein